MIRIYVVTRELESLSKHVTANTLPVGAFSSVERAHESISSLLVRQNRPYLSHKYSDLNIYVKYKDYDDGSGSPRWENFILTPVFIDAHIEKCILDT